MRYKIVLWEINSLSLTIKTYTSFLQSSFSKTHLKKTEKKYELSLLTLLHYIIFESSSENSITICRSSVHGFWYDHSNTYLLSPYVPAKQVRAIIDYMLVLPKQYGLKSLCLLMENNLSKQSGTCHYRLYAGPTKAVWFKIVMFANGKQSIQTIRYVPLWDLYDGPTKWK